MENQASGYNLSTLTENQRWYVFAERYNQDEIPSCIRKIGDAFFETEHDAHLYMDELANTIEDSTTCEKWRIYLGRFKDGGRWLHLIDVVHDSDTRFGELSLNGKHIRRAC